MANTTNFNWETPDDTDLVKDGAAAMRTLGNSIDSSFVDLKGGTTGQILSKASNTDLDYTWVTTDDANAIQNAIVDAKGDLIAASANDTPARLAVGNNGETLVADSSATTGLRYQAPKTNNVVINGNLDIWQRGTTINIGSDGSLYSADRWKGSYGGTGINNVVTRDTSVPNPNSEYSLKATQTGGGVTSLTEFLSRQFIEQSNILPLLGKSCVISFWYRSNKTGSHGVRIFGGYNTGGTDQATTFTVNAADTWEYKTIAVTAFSGVTASSANPTDAGAFVDLGFRVQNNGFTALSTNDYYQFTQMQLEVGSVATPFARAGGTIQGELAACQRYYYRNGATGAYTVLTGLGAADNTTSARFMVQHPVTMRVAPTTLDFANLIVFNPSGGQSSAVSAFVNVYQGTQVSLVGCAVTGLTTNSSYLLYTNNSTAGYIAFSAEL